MPIKFMEGRRPDHSLFELHHTHDPVLHDLFDAFRESITRGRKMNLSIEEDHALVLLWRSVCARYHKLKELEIKSKLLQHCRERAGLHHRCVQVMTPVLLSSAAVVCWLLG